MPYQNLTIENFRGIEKLVLTDLKRVNLLVGRNNCGKTSVLEALFLLSGMSNPQLAVNIHSFRDLILTGDEDFSFMFRDLDFTNPIIISGILDNKKRKLIINPLYADYSSKRIEKQKQVMPPPDTIPASTSIVQLVEGLDLKFLADSARGKSDLNRHFSATISLKEKELNLKGKYKENLHCSFINSKTAMTQIDKRMEGLLIKKKLDSVVAILKGIEPHLSDIRIGSGGMIWVDIGKKNLVPLNIMGDGMRRVLAFMSTISDMKNGVVLLDEIENGLHYSSLSVLSKALFAACKEYNVQLVATTHSYECIESFSKAYEAFAPQKDDIRLFRIDREDDKHNVVTFNAELLKAGIEKEFEVR
jgi:AAA15 family ATPase/GTPase